MFLRSQLRKQDGQEHTCWSVVENKRRHDGRVAQRQVLYLGAVNDSQRAAGRKTLDAHTPEADTTFYRPLVPVEEAFKNLKGDWRGRPVYPQKMGRIEAHLLVACLSDTLHVCLRQRLKLVAGGLTPRGVREKFCAVQVMDVPLPTTDGRTVSLTRPTQPEQELQVLLTQLNLTPPTQPPPKITVAALAVERRLRGHLIRKPRQISLPPFPFRQVRISLSCNLSLAPGFSPVGAGDAAPSRFNGLVAAGAENG